MANIGRVKPIDIEQIGVEMLQLCEWDTEASYFTTGST